MIRRLSGRLKRRCKEEERRLESTVREAGVDPFEKFLDLSVIHP
jgi:hypothetical protein